MREYVIVTDSCCDLSRVELAKMGVKCIDLSFGERGAETMRGNGEMGAEEFYDRMRGGAVFHTSAPSPEAFLEVFAHETEAGRDVIYIAFSSGLSCTSDTARTAAAEFPSGRVTVIDSLCASGGLGMLVCGAARKKSDGMPGDELVSWIKESAPRIEHWFTVGDLAYLRRGGRLSAASAAVGSILSLKPVMHMDDKGRLGAVATVHGRMRSLRMLRDKYMEMSEEPGKTAFYISHGDCAEDARALDDMIFAACGRRADMTGDIGPVIGAHSGPGTLALFFKGKAWRQA